MKMKHALFSKKDKSESLSEVSQKNEIEFEGGFGWDDIINNYALDTVSPDQVNNQIIESKDEDIPIITEIKSHKSTFTEKTKSNKSSFIENNKSVRGTFTGGQVGSRKNTLLSVNRPTLTYKNVKVNTFEELEEKILGRKPTIFNENEKLNKSGNLNMSEKPSENVVKNDSIPLPNYYNILALKIAQRREELEKYNISEEWSESSSNY